MKVRELGAFIRNQRRGAQMSLRKLSAVAGVSLPYLSQIERGLRRPSAEIMQAIAKALRISAQTLYVQAGILDEHPKADVHTAVMGDSGLTERQKQALLAVYASFREETARRRAERKGLQGADALAPAPLGDAAVALQDAADALAEAAVPPVAGGTGARRERGARGAPATHTTTVRAGTGTGRPGRAARNRASGRSETQAETKPSPGSPSASRSPSRTRTPKGGATR